MKITGHVYRRKDTGKFGAYVRVNGKKIRQESGFATKTEARDALRDWETRLRSGTYTSPETERETVAEALTRYGEELARRESKSPASFDANSKMLRLGPKKNGLRSGGLGDLPAGVLTSDLVDRFRDRCLEAGLAKATIDKAVEALRAALIFAVKKGRLARVPSFSFYRPDNRRVGFFEKEDHDRVVANLSPLFADVASFAYASGWRRAEILDLTWERVDRKAGTVRLDDSKNSDRRTLPYAGLAGLSALIERRFAARTYETKSGPAISAFVFHERGRRVGDFRDDWYAACVAAGVGRFVKDEETGETWYEGRLFHDYRRSAVRDLIHAGVDRVTAKLITGHRSDSVFERYAIMTEDDKADGLARLERFRSGAKTKGGDLEKFNGVTTADETGRS